MARCKTASWLIVCCASAIVIYTMGVGPFELAQFRGVNCQQFQWIFQPVYDLGEKPKLQACFYSYLAGWTGESLAEMDSRKNPPLAKYLSSPRAREIERNLGFED